MRLYGPGPDRRRPRKFERESRDTSASKGALNWSMDELGLSSHLRDILRDGGVTTVRDLLEKSKTDLLSLRRLGESQLAECEGALGALGFQLAAPSGEEGDAD